MDNLELYNKLRACPEEAKKPITAGRLKGFTDINPMFRIKALTEAFGPCGFGWWYKITDKRLEGSGKEIRAFVDIELYYVYKGEVSEPVVGTGGASFLTEERSGAYTSDECYKMALTDAISVAAKSLGVAADVYWDKDRDKYTTTDAEPPKNDVPRTTDTKPAPSAKRAPAALNSVKADPDFIPTCSDCGKNITDAEHDSSVRYYGIPLCREHQRDHERQK